ncbi:MAG: hypothetical protein R3B93_01000 [Bacteroidia bacterium]
MGKNGGTNPVELNLTATDKLADNDKLFVMGTRVQLENSNRNFLD